MNCRPGPGTVLNDVTGLLWNVTNYHLSRYNELQLQNYKSCSSTLSIPNEDFHIVRDDSLEVRVEKFRAFLVAFV
jgi:hypothetical protein